MPVDFAQDQRLLLAVDPKTIQTLSSAGRSKECFQACQRLLENGIDKPLAWNFAARSLLDLGQPETALEYAKKAVEADRNNADAYINLAATYQRLRQFKKAIAAALESLRLQPANPEALIKLCQVYRHLNDLPNAVRAIELAIKLDANNANAYLESGRISLEEGEPVIAKELLIKSVELNGKAPESHRYLSIALYLMGDHQASIASIDNAVNLAPACKHNKEVEALLKSKINAAEPISTIKTHANGELPLRQVSPTFPIALKRPVEEGLVDSLRRVRHLELKQWDLPVKGNAKTTTFSLFEENSRSLHFLETDLKALAEEAIGADIYIRDSWCNILRGGGYVPRHSHESLLNRIQGFECNAKNFALVYYVSVGDQGAEDPGFLKFYDPEEYILPEEGTILIFPADRYHSVKYLGAKERIIVGANIWSI